jgi:hypothetical protein
MYLSSFFFDRKRRERSAGPTSLIIKRQRHPFHEKTDAKLVLMDALETKLMGKLMKSRDVVAL